VDPKTETPANPPAGRWRRRWKVILIPTLLAPLAGCLVSFAFSPKYTSQATVLVEPQSAPEIGPPLKVEGQTQRLNSLVQRTLSDKRLRPLIDRLGLVKGSANVADTEDQLRSNIYIEPVNLADTTAPTVQKNAGQAPEITGFSVYFTADNPHEAQEICNELTSTLLQANMEDRIAHITDTMNFLKAQVDEAKRDLEAIDAKLAVFKNQEGKDHQGEEKHEQLLLDYDGAKKRYADMQVKLSQTQAAAQRAADGGQQLQLVNPASLPDDPVFPIRWMFAVGGLGVGWCSGLVLHWASGQ
jgi:uncharacterized protein involved in exopolysaccharide biosynthesis